MSEPLPCPFCNSTAVEKEVERVNGYWAAELLKARTDNQTLRAREAALKARNERLEKALENVVNRYTMNDYTYTGSDSRSDAIKEAKAVLEEGKK